MGLSENFFLRLGVDFAKKLFSFIGHQLARKRGADSPADTYDISAIKDKLYPDNKVPELLGREGLLQDLQRQCDAAQQKVPISLHVVSVWGPQGMGKTAFTLSLCPIACCQAHLPLFVSSMARMGISARI